MLKKTIAIDQLPASQQALLDNNASLADSVSDQIHTANKALQKTLFSENPYAAQENILIDAEHALKSSTDSSIEGLSESSTQYSDFLDFAQLPEETYWDEKITDFEILSYQKKTLEDLRLTHEHLLLNWRKHYDKTYSEWELERIRTFQAEFLKKISDWLEHILKLQDTLAGLGLEPGHLLDFSEGSMVLSDIEQLKKWASYLSEDDGIKKLCNMLGKIRQMGQSEKIEMIKTTKILPEMIFDENAKEEIIGLKVGRDIEHIVPSELALLADEDTSILFDLKYFESNLLCFDMAGLTESTRTEEIEKQQAVTENNKGPLIICIDTSGSMHGQPETIAKALALYLSTQAKKESRDCYLINFSTNIETLDLGNNHSFTEILRFLKTSFHGGTDVAPAMRHGINQMQNKAYEKADLLIISDFIMGDLPSQVLNLIEEQRNQGNRFYSLCIGNHFMTGRIKTHFDSEWIYNPSSASVSELIKFSDTLNRSAS